MAETLLDSFAESANGAKRMAFAGVLQTGCANPVAVCVPDAAEPAAVHCEFAKGGALLVQHDCALDQGPVCRVALYAGGATTV